jgi:hypothetical protein
VLSDEERGGNAEVWGKELTTERERYARLKAELGVDPREVERSDATSTDYTSGNHIDHPLNLDAQVSFTGKVFSTAILSLCRSRNLLLYRFVAHWRILFASLI